MWAAFGIAAVNEALLRDVVARYSEPHRKYHTMQHLHECFEKLQFITAYEAQARANLQRSIERLGS